MEGTDTSAPDTATTPASDGAPAAAAAPVDIGGWPTWLRRTVIGVALLFGVGFAIYGASYSVEGDNSPVDDAIVSLTPGDGAQAPHQTSIGAELAPGFDGRLTINGIAIPEGQMDGAIDPSSVTPEQLERYGLRPNNKNHVFFTPGPGKVIEEFDTGPVNIELEYFKDHLQGSTKRNLAWSIRVD